jgi:hypothetical protein
MFPGPTGRYINKTDAKLFKITSVAIRYKRDTMVTIVKVDLK